MMTAIATDLKEYEPIMRKPRKLKLATPTRVLIVEDDMSLTSLLTSVLESMSPNIGIDWATSGEEAEYYLEREEEVYGKCPYDLIIADIFLEGDVTGLDIWKLCDRKYPESNILVTSSLPIEKFVSCLKNEYACPQYLPKPFSLAECKEAISDFL